MTRIQRFSLLLSLLVAVAGALGGAVAQTPGPSDAEPTTGPVQERAALSAEEQTEQARTVKRRAVAIRDRFMQMLDTARQERDIIRVTCLNDKLTQVNANIETLERRIEALQSASERQDESARNHEYTVVVVLDQKFQVLEQEANQCVGQDLFETGATRVVTEVEENTTSIDPSLVEVPDTDSSNYIPPPASAAR